MKTKSKYIVLIIALLLISTLMSGASAATKVYFFQKNSASYTLSSDYSAFGQRLREMGYNVEELQTGLTREALTKLGVDILVVPNLGTDLTTDEMAALYQFAMDDGKGVFIIGGTPSANRITTPMGMLVVDDTLQDKDNQVIDKLTGQRITDLSTFSIDLPKRGNDAVVNTLTQDVKTLDVFGVNGIYLFGKAKGVVFAGDSANSPKLLNFPTGSDPPVAAYVKLGRGTVFFLSDPDMLVKGNIDAAKYTNDNLKLGINAIDWLAIPSTDNFSDDRLYELITSLGVEKTNMNRTINSLTASQSELNAQISTLTSSNEQAKKQIEGCQNTKLMGIEYIIWAIVAAGVLVAVSLFFAMQKKKGGGKKSKKDGEFGYEFDNKSQTGGEFSDDSAKIGGEVKEEDIEERLKELEKKGSEQQA